MNKRWYFFADAAVLGIIVALIGEIVTAPKNPEAGPVVSFSFMAFMTIFICYGVFGKVFPKYLKYIFEYAGTMAAATLFSTIGIAIFR